MSDIQPDTKENLTDTRVIDKESFSIAQQLETRERLVRLEEENRHLKELVTELGDKQKRLRQSLDDVRSEQTTQLNERAWKLSQRTDTLTRRLDRLFGFWMISTMSFAVLIRMLGSLNMACLNAVLLNPPMVSDSFFASFASKNSHTILQSLSVSSPSTALAATTILPSVFLDLNCPEQLSYHLFQLRRICPHFASHISTTFFFKHLHLLVVMPFVF